MNVSDPAAPEPVGQFDTPGFAYDVSISDGIAYVADMTGVVVVSIADPAAPAILGTLSTAGNAVGIGAGPSCILLTEEQFGLRVLPIQCGPASAPPPVASAGPGLRVAPLRPSPFRVETRIPLTLATPGRVRVEVFDLLGRRVRLISDEFQPPGERQLLWNGRDDWDHRVAGGVYLLRVHFAGGVEEQRIVRLR